MPKYCAYCEKPAEYSKDGVPMCTRHYNAHGITANRKPAGIS